MGEAEETEDALRLLEALENGRLSAAAASLFTIGHPSHASENPGA